jgi:hypothetical protein
MKNNDVDYRYTIDGPSAKGIRAHGGDRVDLRDVIDMLVTLPDPVFPPDLPTKALKAKKQEHVLEKRRIQAEWERGLKGEKARVLDEAKKAGWGELFDRGNEFWISANGFPPNDPSFLARRRAQDLLL